MKKGATTLYLRMTIATPSQPSIVDTAFLARAGYLLANHNDSLSPLE